VQDNSWSCPTAQTCVAVAGARQLAVTTDGAHSWSIESVPVPPGSSGAAIDQVSCPTRQDCVVHLSDHGPGTFMTTVNGGGTWTTASAIPQGSPHYLWLLRCDPGGHCVGLYVDGTSAGEKLAVMRSADSGHTWTAYAVRLPRTGPLLLSCGDARHCMVVTNDGDGIAMTVTPTAASGGRKGPLRAAGLPWRPL
jgi:photosystem II stability/assembly factor-like uncharacterized protein